MDFGTVVGLIMSFCYSTSICCTSTCNVAGEGSQCVANVWEWGCWLSVTWLLKCCSEGYVSSATSLGVFSGSVVICTSGSSEIAYNLACLCP